MRPVKLHIQAMGPYRGEEVIDFTLLADSRFFLIHGPTGSGKTSVLDAMTYALYGSTSGDERSVEQMRSHWADGDTESFVQFDFLIGEKLFRIKRRPGQVLNKKRGSGTRSVDADATLWGVGDETVVLASGAMKVTRKVESMLGFSSEQFRQVIVLPQGKFRELLSAKAEGREEILKVLFGTGKYTLIQNMIKERASVVRGKLDRMRLERSTILAGEGAEKPEDLEQSLLRITSEIDDLNKLLEKLRGEEKRLEGEFRRATVVEERFTEMESASENLCLIENEKDEMEKLSEILDTCRRASVLRDLYNSLAEERKSCGEFQKNIVALREDEAAASGEKIKAEAIFRRLPEKESELKKLENESFLLGSAGKRYEELVKISSEIAVQEKRKIAAEEKISRLSAARGELQVLSADLLRDINAAEIAAVKLQAQQLLVESIIQAGEKISELEKVELSIAETEKEVAELEKARVFTLDKLRNEESSRKRLEELWYRGQALVLAQDLEEGKPCPVCGSRHHPSPAAGSGEVPSLEEIEVLRKTGTLSSEELNKTEMELVQKNSELEFLKMRRNSGRDIPEDLRSMSTDELRVIYKTEKDRLEALKRVAGSLESLKVKHAEQEKELGFLISEIEETSPVLKNSEITLSSLEGQFNQLKMGLPEGIPDIKSLKIRIAELEKRIIEIRSEISGTEENYRSASENHTALKTLLGKSEEDFREAGERLLLKNREFQGRLAEEKFSNEEDFVAALDSAGSINDIEQRLEYYRVRLISATDRAKRAAAGIEKLERPDLSTMTAKISELKTESESVIGRIKAGESEAVRLTRLTGKLKELDNLHETEEKNYGIIQTLAETAGGKNIMRLSFQRYVLQSLFEDVLVMASSRLEKMSRGRYRLVSPGRVSDRRMTGGLDLEVFDEYTGYSRPVVTLSGGESFLASLSLALGLADLVQQYSGGIYLDTVFIDEGFGSLDSETLDLAIDTLVDLQSSGRLVGIISHVNELKERIDSRLEVVPAACGSTTRFVVSGGR